MRTSPILILLPVLLLGACEAKVERDAKDDGNSSVVLNAAGGQFSLDTSDFKAKLNLPKLDLMGTDMDIDGVKLYPGSKVSAVNVDAHGGKDGAKDEGKVTIAFASADAPARLLDYYRKAFTDNGFTVAAASGGEMALSAAKAPDKQVKLALQPAGDGSTGTIVVTGG